MADPLDQIEAEASETVAHADVCVDGRLLADYHDALGRLSSFGPSKMLEDVDLDELHASVRDLHARVKERTHRYTFACIDRQIREGLADKYPPSKKQQGRGHEDYDPDRFEPALAAHALVEIDGDPVDRTVERLVEHFEGLRRNLPPGKHGWGELWNAVLASNGEGTQVPKSVSGIVDQFVSELNSITPPDEGSD